LTVDSGYEFEPLTFVSYSLFPIFVKKVKGTR